MSATGQWNLVVDTPMGKQTGTLDLTVDGGNVTGVSTAMGMSDPIENGSADGQQLAFQVHARKPFPMLIKFELTLQDDDTLGGQVAIGSFGKAGVSGTRA